MCGIVGYIGNRQAQSILLNNLEKLEYRGYDSCGIALANSGVKVYKDAVRVAELNRSIPRATGTIGIGHTRWATHGAPSQRNAHPHCDCSGRIALVHNGVISNYQQLKNQLVRDGHRFSSETDTEVLVHLVEKYYSGDLEEAVKAALKDVEGSYAIIVMMDGYSGLVVARKDSPLVLGVGDRENFIASDVPAMLEYTNRVIYLEDGDIGVICADSIRLSHHDGEVQREEQKILWTAAQAEKGGYEHFMLKEIHEQPQVIRDTISEYLSTFDLPVSFVNNNGYMKSILMLACGTSYHAAMLGKYIGESLTGIAIRVEMASEFNYIQNPIFTPMAIGITQSGETADTLKAMRRLKETESKVIAITNVVGSTASKIADRTIYTRAGPEISVAATKSFIAQLISMYWLALTYSHLEPQARNDLVVSMRKLPGKIQQVLDDEALIAENAARLAAYENIFFIGRGINYAIAMEGALKLKEVSYIHSEAYAAGEIKHGPFALLSKSTPVVAIVARDSSHNAMLTSIKEIKARGSPVFAIAERGDEAIEELADFVMAVPPTNELLSPFMNTVAVQLLAYFAAKERACPIDFPRNLAKSVTVE